jgi:hypothetical protein
VLLSLPRAGDWHDRDHATGQGADETVQPRTPTTMASMTRPARAPCGLLNDGRAAAAYASFFWSGLCFLPVLFILLVFAPLALTGTRPTFAEATAVASQNLPLAGVLVLLLLALIALDSFWRLTRRYRRLWREHISSRRLADAQLAGAVAGTAMVTGTYALMVSNKALPLTEGWFEVFARYVNAGKVPYRDFDLLATPLYTYILAGITRVFGYDLIVLRLVGVIVFVAIAVTACLVFSRLFTPFVAMVAACVTAFFLQAEVTNVFYDYIRFFDLLANATCLSLLIHVLATETRRSRLNWALIACGLCSAGALLIRQSSGAVLVAAVLAVLGLQILAGRGTAQRLTDLIVYVVALLAPIGTMVAVMVTNGSLRPFLTMTSGDALTAKGGLPVVLFGWVSRFWPEVIAVRGSVTLMLGLLAVSGALYLLAPRPTMGCRDGLLWSAAFFTAALAGVLFCVRFSSLSSAFEPFRLLATPYSVYPVVTILCAFSLVQLVRSRSLTFAQRRFFLGLAVLTFMVLAIGYGSATSGGFSEGQTALALGTIFASILFLAGHVLGTPARLITVTVCVGLCLSYVSYKIDAPYAWWGLREPSMREAIDSVSVPGLRGIRVSPQTKAAIEGVTSAITDSSRPGDDVFVFPHMPILYLLTDRYPSTFTLVQWFDFSSRHALAADMSRTEDHPPRVVVIVEVPDWVYTAHESLFWGGHTSAQRSMRDRLERLVHADPYHEVGAWSLTDGYRIVVYAADHRHAVVDVTGFSRDVALARAAGRASPRTASTAQNPSTSVSTK